MVHRKSSRLPGAPDYRRVVHPVRDPRGSVRAAQHRRIQRRLNLVHRSGRLEVRTLVLKKTGGGVVMLGILFACCAAFTPPRHAVIPRITVTRALVAPVPQRAPAGTYAGNVTTFSPNGGQYASVTYDATNKSYYLVGGEILDELYPDGHDAHIGNGFFSYGYPSSIVWDNHSQTLYVSVPSAYVLLSVTPAGNVSFFAGGKQGTQDGTGSGAQFQGPTGLTLDPVNHLLYVVDNDRIRTVTEGGTVTTIGQIGAFTGGGADAFDTRTGDVAVMVPPQDSIYLYSASTKTFRDLAGRCIPAPFPSSCQSLHFDGTGSRAFFGSVNDVHYDPVSNAFYVADGLNFEIRKVAESGDVSTLAGSGAPTAIDGLGLSASFYYPDSLTLDTATDSLGISDGGFRFVTLKGLFPPPPS